MINAIALAACMQAPFYLHDGDRVTWYGDSITEDGRYGAFVEMFVRTRFPKLNVRFTNCGWGGDKVTGGGGGNAQDRIDKDFRPSNPTVVTIMLGMNDGNYAPFSAETDSAFASGYDKLIQLMQGVAPKARYTLILSSPFDDFAHQPKNYNEVLLKMGAHVKDLASKYRFDYIDFNDPLAKALTQAAKDNPQLAVRILPDAVHPQEAGHLLMAATLLKSWNAPSLVSEVTIDAKTGDVKRSEGTKVTKTGQWEWKQTDAVLPMPINFGDPAVGLIADPAGVLDALDDEMLMMPGLPTGTYSITIDGQEAGRASADDLGKGINLSKMKTPMMAQALAVGSYVLQKVQINMQEWRQFRRQLDWAPSAAAASKAMQAVEEDLTKKAQSSATPTTHTFVVAKVP
ncbi:MAG TPA: SGNH/GDSL hydrolase family protein [Fimbriimonadaceae bacterium]|nr:SGNH/GDSL hydrolase family protein [Fimbriimonadaceae bacterium]